MTVHTLPSGATLTDVGTPGGAPKPACIVFPGGGYVNLAPHEGDPVAQWMESVGVRGFVLRYHVAPTRHPVPVDDAHAAIRLVRSNAAAWGVRPDKLGICGFSAGGHLASTASTHWGSREERPDFALLIYPVISFHEPLVHRGSRDALLGPNPDPYLVDALSNEDRVSLDTPPTFLVHGVDDTVVPVGNALAYATALAEHRVPFELHAIAHGPHGFGLGTPGSPQDWRPQAARWLAER